MTLKQLKDIVNSFSDEQAKEMSVVVELKEFSIGPSATESINAAFAGFDWDNGKFMMLPEKPLMRYRADRADVKLVSKFIRRKDGIVICKCPSCRVDIDTLDKFCKNCGQEFK